MTQQYEATFAPSFIDIAKQVAIHARFQPGKTAFIEGDRTVSWQEYHQSGNRLAQALTTCGIKKGDRIAMLTGNSYWAHELILGIWRAGAVVVPLSPLSTPDVLGNMLADSGARYLFTSPGYLPLAVAATKECAIPVVAAGAEFESFVSNAPDTSLPLRLNRDDLAVIIYSSGTTGTPKGIAHTHDTRLQIASMCLSQFKCHQDSVCLSIIPPHSNGAWLSWMPAKLIGATTVLMPHFDPDEFIATVRKHRPTYGFLVPAICAVLLEHPEIESAGLESFETAITAGAPMPVEMKKSINRLTGGALYELWGLTEGVATVITPSEMEQRPDSVGRPIVGCDLRIINEQDQDITFNGVGEIVGYSSGLMVGYWNRPDANQELIWTDDTGQVFIRTGDIGEFDRDGFLTLRGRAKDMIISGGLNVFPIDIETVLLGHEQIKDACVIGIEHDKWGETPIAYVIANTGANLNPEALKEWANEQLTKPQRLSNLVLYTGDFPRNTLGKVLKNDLKARYLNHQE